MKTLIILLLSCGIAQAQSTFTVKPIELTDEQKDINVISISDIEELKLLKDIKYDYLTDEINDKQAILQIQERRNAKNKANGKNYSYPIYKDQKDAEVKKIEAEDLAIESGLGDGGFVGTAVAVIMAIFMLVVGIVSKVVLRKRKP